MKLSEQGAAFIARHEGFVSKAYRDPVGVWTIGTGFTNRSKEFTKRFGRIVPGARISRERNADLLRIVADAEYGAAVMRHIRPSRQHHYDGATSVCFNLGPGAAKWRWARALAAGRVTEAARLLRQTGTTAGGRRLRGLVRRRREEAVLIEHGSYGNTAGKSAGSDSKDHAALIRTYQTHLARLGFDPGLVDGIAGPQTQAAVRAFQSHHPDLIDDGILGPATRAQIDRSIAKRRIPTTALGSGSLAAGAALTVPAAGAPDWLLWAALGLAIVIGLGIIVLIARHKEDL
ncbi:MAG: peptidoglycan-binding protein [Pseudomonadota bacterium]